MEFKIILKDTIILREILTTLDTSLNPFKFDLTFYVIFKSTGITIMFEDYEKPMFNIEINTDDSFYSEFICEDDYIIRLENFQNFLKMISEYNVLEFHSDNPTEVRNGVLEGLCNCFDQHNKLQGTLPYLLIQSSLFSIGIATSKNIRETHVHSLNWLRKYTGYLSLNLNKNILDSVNDQSVNLKKSIFDFVDKESFAIFVNPSTNSFIFNYDSVETKFDKNDIERFLPSTPSKLDSFITRYPSSPLSIISNLILYFPSDPLLICPFYYEDGYRSTPIYLFLNLNSRIKIQLFINSRRPIIMHEEMYTKDYPILIDLPEFSPELNEKFGWDVIFNTTIPKKNISLFRDFVTELANNPTTLYNSDFLKNIDSDKSVNDLLLDPTKDVLPPYEFSRLSVDDEGHISFSFLPNDYKQWRFCNYIAFKLSSFVSSGDLTFYFRHNEETPLLFRKYFFYDDNLCLDHFNDNVSDEDSLLMSPPFSIHPGFEKFKKNKLIGTEPIDFIGVDLVGARYDAYLTLHSSGHLDELNSNGTISRFRIGIIKDVDKYGKTDDNKTFAYCIDACWPFGQLNYNLKLEPFKSSYNENIDFHKETIASFIAIGVVALGGRPFLAKLLRENNILPAFPFLNLTD